MVVSAHSVGMSLTGNGCRARLTASPLVWLAAIGERPGCAPTGDSSCSGSGGSIDVGHVNLWGCVDVECVVKRW